MPVSNVQTQALATVLHRAIIQARLLVYRVASETQEESSRRTLQQIAALMDAIHNVPQGLLATEGPDVANLLRDFQVYDEDFADGREVPSLWGPTALLAAVGWSERHVSRHQANSYAESMFR